MRKIRRAKMLCACQKALRMHNTNFCICKIMCCTCVNGFGAYQTTLCSKCFGTYTLFLDAKAYTCDQIWARAKKVWHVARAEINCKCQLCLHVQTSLGTYKTKIARTVTYQNLIGAHNYFFVRGRSSDMIIGNSVNNFM